MASNGIIKTIRRVQGVTSRQMAAIEMAGRYFISTRHDLGNVTGFISSKILFASYSEGVTIVLFTKTASRRICSHETTVFAFLKASIFMRMTSDKIAKAIKVPKRNPSKVSTIMA